MDRKRNASRNLIFGFFNKLILIIFPFILRTVIINYLGSDYLGLNSLFASILQVLNLAELGFSSAIVFCLYKPIAEKDTDSICALLNAFKRIYCVIGCIVMFFGLIILPIIPFFINGTYPDDINIFLLFILYLFNTSVSYFFFAYKNALFIAHQRSDITSFILSIISVFQYSLQIVSIIIFKNFYLYIIINIFSSIINNYIVSYYADKYYPDYICYGSLSKEVKNQIKYKVFGLMIQKVCAVSRNSFDSIFISLFLGLNIVAIYNNYYTIIHSVIGFLSIISTSILAGVGNSIVLESVRKNYHDMKLFNFIYMIICGWCSIFLICLFQPFMLFWMGSNYLLDFNIVILLVVYFYILKMGDIRSIYSDAKGLWWENKYRAVLESFANIILNYFLGKYFGIFGIIFATILSLFIINFIYGSQILFKHYFIQVSVLDYFKDHFIYACVTFVISFITYFICNSFVFESIYLIILFRSFICVVIPLFLYFIFYCRCTLFKESKNFFISFIKKI